MASKEQPDQLAMHFRRQLDAAEVALDNGDWEKTKDVCLRLRYNPTVGIYARARLNLLLARVHKPDDYSEIYAYECIDLLDLYRQDFAGQYSSWDASALDRMESASKDIIDDIARERAKIAAETEKPIDEGLEDLHLMSPVKKDPIAEAVAKQRDLKQKSKSSDGETEPKKNYTVTVLQSKPRTPEELVEMAKNREKYELKVEGYLRRGGNYKPLEKYVPLSRGEKLVDGEDMDEEDFFALVYDNKKPEPGSSEAETVTESKDAMEMDIDADTDTDTDMDTPLPFIPKAGFKRNKGPYPSPEPSSDL